MKLSGSLGVFLRLITWQLEETWARHIAGLYIYVYIYTFSFLCYHHDSVFEYLFGLNDVCVGRSTWRRTKKIVRRSDAPSLSYSQTYNPTLELVSGAFCAGKR